MKLVIQRVTEASVAIEGVVTGKIDRGFMVLLGIGLNDQEDDIAWLIQKLVGLRIFDDENGTMNLSLKQVGGSVLVVSQFTLMASTKKGNRPSYIIAARPADAEVLYEKFVSQLKNQMEGEVATGTFGADMKVSLTNDGPVTIIIDSKNRV